MSQILCGPREAQPGVQDPGPAQVSGPPLNLPSGCPGLTLGIWSVQSAYSSQGRRQASPPPRQLVHFPSFPAPLRTIIRIIPFLFLNRDRLLWQARGGPEGWTLCCRALALPVASPKPLSSCLCPDPVAAWPFPAAQPTAADAGFAKIRTQRIPGGEWGVWRGASGQESQRPGDLVPLGRETRTTSEGGERGPEVSWLAGWSGRLGSCLCPNRHGWGAAALGIWHVGCPLP